jgi:hypothetical protein
MAVSAELGELGHAVDELRHLGSETLLNVLQSEVRILRHVVQDRGRHGDRIDADVGEDLGRGQRVGDIRLAGYARLAVVRHLGHLESGPERRQVCLRVVPGDGVAHVPEARLGRGKHGQAEAQAIGERQARDLCFARTPRLGRAGPVVRSTSFESTSRSEPARRAGDRLEAQQRLEVYRPGQREVAPTFTEVKLNGLPPPEARRVTVGRPEPSGIRSRDPLLTARCPILVWPLKVMVTLSGAENLTVATRVVVALSCASASSASALDRVRVAVRGRALALDRDRVDGHRVTGRGWDAHSGQGSVTLPNVRSISSTSCRVRSIVAA